MGTRKEWEMAFMLSASMSGSYSATFSKAQRQIEAMQKEIFELSKTQANISAYQKQQKAVNATIEKLKLYEQQYANIRQEMAETGVSSSALKNQLLTKQKQIESTTQALEEYQSKLKETERTLEDAGVDTKHLTEESGKLENEIQKLKDGQKEAANSADTFGNKAVAAFDAIATALAATGIDQLLDRVHQEFEACAEASVAFESAITGVEKTTDFTASELATMEDELRAMATEIPATTEELAAIAEAAGQLGIQKESIVSFTETMAMLGTATNLSAEEGATSLARIANITRMSQDNYGRLGATIVALGNNFATTESEIVAMATRLASAGTLIGMTEPEIMALSASMSSVGIEAEAGGTAMTQTIANIESAVAEGGDTLLSFARIAGMSANDFSYQWETAPVSAITAFIEGLGRLDEQGESAVLILDELGLSGVRQSNMLQSLGLAADVVSDAVSLSNDAWSKNVALVNEANKRYQTTASQQQMMYNAFKNLRSVVGDTYTPALQKLYSVLTNILVKTTVFVEKHPLLVKSLVAGAAATTLMIKGFLLYKTVMIAVIPLVKLFTATVVSAKVALGGIIGVFGLAAGAVALFSATSKDATDETESLSDAEQELLELTGELSDADQTLAADTTEVMTKIQSTYDSVDALSEAYKELYEAAYNSVHGQYDLWDEVESVSTTSIATMTKNLDQQASYWSQYNENLSKLVEKSSEIEGLREMIASFSDGSKESVGAIAGMAAASDDQLRTLVAKWQKMAKEESAVIESITWFGIDLESEMLGLMGELEKDVDGMNLSAEAAEAGRETLQGYLDGATEMLPQVYSVFQSASQGVLDSLNGSYKRWFMGDNTGNESRTVNAYASGTNSAEPGFALVGENGPELVYLNGGEQILTAAETARLQQEMHVVAIMPQFLQALSSNVLSAESSAGSTGAVSVAVTFQISGNTSSETVNALQDYGDDFAAHVLEVIADAEDSARGRAYR